LLNQPAPYEALPGNPPARKTTKRIGRLPASSRSRWRRTKPACQRGRARKTMDLTTERTNLRPTDPSCETGGNGEPCSALMRNVAERTRQCSASSHKTNPATQKRAAVRAELSSRCNRAEAGITKRTRADPSS
jgi:hypothetical protein